MSGFFPTLKGKEKPNKRVPINAASRRMPGCSLYDESPAGDSSYLGEGGVTLRDPSAIGRCFPRVSPGKIPISVLFFTGQKHAVKVVSGMAVHRLVTKAGIYFITFTNYQWRPLIKITDAFDLVYKWFDILREKGHCINAYVVMPNHLHLILFYAGGRQSLNTIVGNGKRFIAYEIINRLKALEESSLLKTLNRAVRDKDMKRGKKHEVWTDSFDVKECRTENFIMQKLIYIHANPCKGKWNLAKTVIDYPHSSASFYISRQHSVYAVKDYREFLNREAAD